MGQLIIDFVSLKDYKSNPVVRMIHPILGKNLFLPGFGANRKHESSPWFVHGPYIHGVIYMTYTLPLFNYTLCVA